jgi:hypothetical protein
MLVCIFQHHGSHMGMWRTEQNGEKMGARPSIDKNAENHSLVSSIYEYI